MPLPADSAEHLHDLGNLLALIVPLAALDGVLDAVRDAIEGISSLALPRVVRTAAIWVTMSIGSPCKISAIDRDGLEFIVKAYEGIAEAEMLRLFERTGFPGGCFV